MDGLFKIPFSSKGEGKENAIFYERLFTKLRKLYEMQEEIKNSEIIRIDVIATRKDTSLSRMTSIVLNDGEVEEFEELISQFIRKYEILKSK